MFSRRDIGRVALASLPLARAFAKLDSRVNGVLIGAHARIGGDVPRRAFEQNPPADHHDDARGKAKHQVHVVLDE